ncbi:MAG: nicotinate-nucleotide adenylyltransferase [Chitinophagaceae bacterium]|jgi:nicotinate-nucleotide adenylyltransferase|nr:nicotinate-nucleotide adenylyltransferase [Chitinophagaceae bacterium]OQY92384.1 MAG: nicotinic acid mononucleotide adenylyltransferase [Sphingobacteriales bacterium UTBCD1]
MIIGLYFGSFNPIHIGHLIIANHVLNETDLKKIWFVVSPQNPLKTESGLLNEYQRLHLLRLATEDDTRIKVSDIEFHLPRPSFTSNTLAYLQEKYPARQFKIIMGSDSFQNLHKWKNWETIVSNYEIIVYLRPGFEIENKIQAKLIILNAPLLEISSTHIRELIAQKKSARYLVTDKVYEEILKGRYYVKK